jgi:choline dehydrogenase-like flavoprotein
MTLGAEPRARSLKALAPTRSWRASRTPQSLQAEVLVIGSGPGGSVTASLLAEAGRDVLLVEEGPFVPLEACAPFSLEEMVAKYRNGGVTVAMGPTKVAYVEGRCVGGGSEINSGLYHRTPADVLEAWRRDYQVEALTEADLRPHFEACERDVSVSYLPGPAPAASLKLHEGAGRLGWKSLEVPRWFRYDAPAGSAGPKGSRQSMTKTFIPRALKAGCRLLPNTKASRLRRVDGRWLVEGRSQPVNAPPESVEIEAETVFVCGGAVQTPALLRRSGISRHVGDSLRMHPTVKVIARFPDEINAAGMEVPVHQVKEFAPRFSFGCSISSPPHLALGMSDHPRHLGEVDRHWRNMAVYYAMIAGSGSGSVRGIPGFGDSLVRYGVTCDDLAELSLALRQLCRLLFQAGAVALYPSVSRAEPLTSEADLWALPGRLPKSRTSLMTIHLFSSCPMGENPRLCATDSFGKVHRCDGLYVSDASLLCTPPGVNPQGSIMAIARRNALKYLGRL